MGNAWGFKIVWISWAVHLAAIVGSLILVGLCFLAIGAAIRRALGARLLNVDDCFLSFWVGYAAVLWLLILWSFSLPVDTTAQVAIVTAAAACLPFCWNPLMGILRQGIPRVRFRNALVLLIAVLWLANLCVGSFESWDGVLYHIQSVAWAKAHKVIPGIANLHGPLAFNNSSFLYDALIDGGIWEGRGFHVANGTLLAVSVLQSLWSGLRWRRHGPQAKSYWLFSFLLLPIAVYHAPNVTTFSTDLPMALVISAAAALAYRMLDECTATRADATSLALLFAAAISIKFSALIFAGFALATLTFAASRTSWNSAGIRHWSWAGIVSLLFLGSWVIRGIILSGYPFFPLPYGALAVDWRAPLEQAQAELAYIAFTERGFSWHVVGAGWLRLSFGEELASMVIPAAMAAIGIVQWRRITRKAHGLQLPHRQTWLLLVPALAAAVTWMVSAPSHRYAPAIFWPMAALSLSELLRAAAQITGRVSKLAWTAAVLVTISPWMASSISTLLRHGVDSAISSVQRAVVGSRYIGLAPLPQDFPTETFVTASGFRLNSPAFRPNAENRPNGCGNAPLPCTANPAANLELRQPGVLDAGFRVRGPWMMLNWPYRWQPRFLAEWRSRQRAPIP